MRILLTNDDGILAQGLWAMARALQGVGEVVVVAPDREQSGVGTSVTLHQPVRATEVPAPLPGVRAFAVEGTPSDCIILALSQLAQGPVDLVVSGINDGANLGADVLISGTVAGALQAYFHGIPGIAVSVASLRDVHYGPAASLGSALARLVLEGQLPRPLLLNVNLPNLPPEGLKGVRITTLGKRAYMDIVQAGDDGKRRWYWIQRTRPVMEPLEGTDVWAVLNGYASITPLQTDLTDEVLIARLRGVVGRVEGALQGG